MFCTLKWKKQLCSFLKPKLSSKEKLNLGLDLFPTKNEVFGLKWRSPIPRSTK
jgi:hypothetical protein